VFALTRHISQGPFASPKRLPELRASGITHILNVGEAPSILRPEDGAFAEILWCPVADMERLKDAVAIKCVDALHRMACVDQANVYVHCIAGWNRSPTVVWLYFVACGIDPVAAKDLIVCRNWDAIPGHSLLVDDALVSMIRNHGSTRFFPHPRPEVLEPLR
jgi:hypothetical protein